MFQGSPVMIQNGNYSLAVLQSDSYSLELTLNDQKSENKFGFSLGFYKTYRAGKYNTDSGFLEQHSSGHYSFSTTQQEPLPLAKFESISLVKGDAVTQIVAKFKAPLF